MTVLLIAFVTLCLMAVVFSLMPILPGPPFAMVAIMMIPFWPDLAVEPDQLMWWVSGSMAALGLVITIIDIAAPTWPSSMKAYWGRAVVALRSDRPWVCLWVCCSAW